MKLTVRLLIYSMQTTATSYTDFFESKFKEFLLNRFQDNTSIQLAADGSRHLVHQVEILVWNMVI